MKIDERIAKLVAALVYVSLMGVLNFYQGDPADYIDLEIPVAIRGALRWAEQVDSSAPELRDDEPQPQNVHSVLKAQGVAATEAFDS